LRDGKSHTINLFALGLVKTTLPQATSLFSARASGPWQDLALAAVQVVVVDDDHRLVSNGGPPGPNSRAGLTSQRSSRGDVLTSGAAAQSRLVCQGRFAKGEAHQAVPTGGGDATGEK
jgi:hypothetical protein